MPAVSFGVMFFTNQPVPRVAELAQLAEQLGYESAWFLDSQLVGRDVFVAMASSALKTSRIGLGPGVTHTVTRHPSVTASGFASLAELAPGRLKLAIGFGDSAIRGLGGKPARLDKFRHDFRMIQALLAGDSFPLDGQAIKLAWSDPALTQSIPLYAVPGHGPKSLALAGELGQGVVVYCAEYHLDHHLKYVAEGAARIGKRLEDLDLIWWVNTSISDDWEAVKEHLGPRLASGIRHRYYDYMRGALTAEQVRVPIPLAKQIAKHYNFLEHATPGASHAKLLEGVPEEVWKDGMLVGAPAEVVALLKRVLPSYPFVRRVVLHMPVATSRMSIESIMGTFASQVRPKLDL